MVYEIEEKYQSLGSDYHVGTVTAEQQGAVWKIRALRSRRKKSGGQHWFSCSLAKLHNCNEQIIELFCISSLSSARGVSHEVIMLYSK